jgi:hypothetical protein
MLFRLYDLAERERYKLDKECEMTGRTDALRARLSYVIAVYHLIAAELDRKNNEPIDSVSA